MWKVSYACAQSDRRFPSSHIHCLNPFTFIDLFHEMSLGTKTIWLYHVRICLI